MFKNIKRKMELLKKGRELLAQQPTDITEYDNDFIVVSKDINMSLPIVARAIKNGQDKIIIMLPQGKHIFAASDGFIDEAKAKKQKIGITPFPVNGGAIVMDKDDVAVLLVYKSRKRANWVGHIQKKVIDMLAEKGADAVVKGNDIEINGKKISGGAITQNFGTTIEYIFFACNNLNKLANDLCTEKNRVRETAGLKDYNIDPAEFTEFIKTDIERFWQDFKKGAV